MLILFTHPILQCCYLLIILTSFHRGWWPCFYLHIRSAMLDLSINHQITVLFLCSLTFSGKLVSPFFSLVTTAWDGIHMVLGYVFFQEWLTLGDILPNDRNATLSLYGLQILWIFSDIPSFCMVDCGRFIVVLEPSVTAHRSWCYVCRAFFNLKGVSNADYQLLIWIWAVCLKLILIMAIKIIT